MKLIASVIVRNETDRYLAEWLVHLAEFVDGIVAIDDGSTDGSGRLLSAYGAVVHRNEHPEFYAHEGRARQKLLDLTMEQKPTHILAVDADEFVTGGEALRAALSQRNVSHGVWSLSMQEVWRATPEGLLIRTDGSWGPWPVVVAYSVPGRVNPRTWRIRDAQLACGRVPMHVQNMAGRARRTGVSVLHFGWANESDRYARWSRYAVHDGGRFHSSAHLDSILWTSEKVKLAPIQWPLPLARYQPQLIARANREADGNGSQGPPADAAFVSVHEDGRWVALDYEGTIITGTL